MAATSSSSKVLALGQPLTLACTRDSVSARLRLHLNWRVQQPLRWKLAHSGRQACARQRIWMVLPTGQPERSREHARPLWSARAIKAFSMAELEARKLKYPTTGTESLLLGILTEGTSHAAKFLRANGVTLFGVRDEAVKLLGKADMYFFSPEHPPLTDAAQKALDWALDDKARQGSGSGGDGEVTTSHILLGIWSQKESAGYRVLGALGLTDAQMEQLSDSVRNFHLLEACKRS